VVAGKFTRGKADFREVQWGAWGMLLGLLLMSLYRPGPNQSHLLGFAGSVPVLVLLGISAGCFAIPVQVFLQTRPPEGQKGRLIAAMNQTNFIAILCSGVVYSLFDRLVIFGGFPRSPIFALTALLLLPVAILYRPRAESR